MVWVILLGGLVIMALIPVPIGVGLGLTGLALLQFTVGGATDLAIPAVWNVLADYTFSALPMFILMGEIMLVSGMSSSLYSAMSPIFARVPGKLLHTNIVASTIFGAVSGTSTATAAAVGSVAYPELAKRGYDRQTVVATLAAGGTLGLLIPPSISLILFGATQQVSIGRLFLAGILPGLLIAAFFMILILIITYRRPSLVPEETGGPVSLGEIFRNLASIWPFGLLIFMVLGTIYLGLATSIEAAGLGVVAAAVLGATWGDLTLKSLWTAIVRSMNVFVAIGVILIGALILAQALSILGVPFEVLSLIKEMNLSPVMVLVMVVIFYLILGCFFDGISLLLMTLPVVFPIMTAMGYDPVWLGVVITILIEIGMLTPPVGMNLFVITGITGGEVSLLQAARASMPFWLVLVGSVALFTLFPQIVLFLPSMMN
ncbi:MAG: TRAP transporter large permease [Rhizobiaceae bacterium]|nr:TRAP transporter large permease [Rhizobiaceae bacterium]